jgi:Tol biopolymer transport system component
MVPGLSTPRNLLSDEGINSGGRKIMKRLIQLFVLVSLCFSFGCAKLVFVSKRNGHEQIYKMRITGTSQTNVSNNTFTDHYPDVSHHGKGIVFSSLRSGPGENIYAMDLDGGSVQQITTGTLQRTKPNWGREDLAKLIAYSYPDFRQDTALWTVYDDGTNARKITNPAPNTESAGEQDDGGHDFWHGGKMIVFSRYDLATHDRDLYSIYFDGTQDFVRITNTQNVSETQPVISHDGKLLAYRAFYRQPSFKDTIRIVQVGTWLLVNEIELQAPASKNISGIDFSRNDKRLYFAAESSDVPGSLINNKLEIFSVKLDGTDQRRLTDNEVSDTWPSVIPCHPMPAWLCGILGE